MYAGRKWTNKKFLHQFFQINLIARIIQLHKFEIRVIRLIVISLKIIRVEISFCDFQNTPRRVYAAFAWRAKF